MIVSRTVELLCSPFGKAFLFPPIIFLCGFWILDILVMLFLKNSLLFLSVSVSWSSICIMVLLMKHQKLSKT